MPQGASTRLVKMLAHTLSAVVAKHGQRTQGNSQACLATITSSESDLAEPTCKKICAWAYFAEQLEKALAFLDTSIVDGLMSLQMSCGPGCHMFSPEMTLQDWVLENQPARFSCWLLLLSLAAEKAPSTACSFISTFHRFGSQ